MKTISSPAMAAIEAGEAIVTGAVEIIPRSIAYLNYNAQFNYHVVGSVVDADPPEDVVPPSAGFGSTANAPFGHDSGAGLTPILPIATAWAPQTSLWLKKDITTEAGTLTLSGYVENGAVFFWDDELVGSVNADNSESTTPTGIPYNISFSVTSGAHTLKVLCLDETATGSGDNTYFYVQVIGTTSGDGGAIRVWGGYGPIEIGGETYQGIGDRGLAQQTAGAIGGFAQGLQLTLSGIEPAALELLDADEIKGASVVVRRLIFGSEGKTLLDASVFDRGRVDAVETVETIGGGAAIQVMVETAARGLGSSGARQRSDSDQRLINPNDGYFKHVAWAGEKKLYWGGRRPVTMGGSGGRISATEFMNRMFAYRSASG